MIAAELHQQSASITVYIVPKRIQALCQKSKELDNNLLTAMARPRALPIERSVRLLHFVECLAGV